MSALVARSTQQDKTQDLQRTLYRAAKAEPGRRFHALYNKVHRRDVLERAWDQVRRNRGAAGIDRITLAVVERCGVDRLLDEAVEGTSTVSNTETRTGLTSLPFEGQSLEVSLVPSQACSKEPTAGRFLERPED